MVVRRPGLHPLDQEPAEDRTGFLRVERLGNVGLASSWAAKGRADQSNRFGGATASANRTAARSPTSALICPFGPFTWACSGPTGS